MFGIDDLMGLLSIGGGLKSLLSPDQDPYAAQRDAINKQLSDLSSGRMANAIQMRGDRATSELSRKLEDQAAASGLPSNVLAQTLLRASTEGNMNTEQALAQNEQDVLARKAQLLGMLPPTQVDNSGAQLLSTGLQGLNAFGSPSWLGGKGALAQTGVNKVDTGVNKVVSGDNTSIGRPFPANFGLSMGGLPQATQVNHLKVSNISSAMPMVENSLWGDNHLKLLAKNFAGVK